VRGGAAEASTSSESKTAPDEQAAHPARRFGGEGQAGEDGKEGRLLSDALSWLVKARPEAMGAYFRFLKDAGSRLDPKTRNLISVITKVHAQTANGLRQYLKRALREGASAEEVLDALLMAFPALGLAKIVWAVDVILAMDLPEFRREPAKQATLPQWHDVGAAGDAKSGKPLRLDCGDRGLFVFRKGRTLKVYDSRCPHEATNIPHLALKGGRLTCPKHEWAFDLATGACVAKGDRPLNELPHKVANQRLLVYW
jgi:nitrite reductase/ring-hydroxylating ferredoxin subunit/alkylhydroperoxidase/carboxymuconolactone decarboxylase family protein YurZ